MQEVGRCAPCFGTGLEPITCVYCEGARKVQLWCQSCQRSNSKDLYTDCSKEDCKVCQGRGVIPNGEVECLCCEGTGEFNMSPRGSLQIIMEEAGEQDEFNCRGTTETSRLDERLPGNLRAQSSQHRQCKSTAGPSHSKSEHHQKNSATKHQESSQELRVQNANNGHTNARELPNPTLVQTHDYAISSFSLSGNLFAVVATQLPGAIDAMTKALDGLMAEMESRPPVHDTTEDDNAQHSGSNGSVRAPGQRINASFRIV